MHNKQTIDLDFDREHIWHPYTSMTTPLPVYPVSHAKANRIFLETGEALIDGMASWWSAIHGYCHPVLNEAITKQLGKMSHVMFGGLTHKPAVELAKKLVEITPSTLNKVFLADSGSVSVEVAIKMALQYWLSQGIKTKQKLMTPLKGYHGDTFAAMSVCDPVNSMHSMYSGFLPEHVFVPAPVSRFNETFDIHEAETLEVYFKEHHQDVAAFIIEPIVQNAGGMNFYHPEYLRHIRALCDKYNVLLICDEIATGFGRTGKLFAVEHADIEPDIMCIGKALTGGMMTLSATLTTSKVAVGISEGEAGVLMHGPTFMGNPLACETACASIDLLLEQPWQEQIVHINEVLTEQLSKCKQHANVVDVRTLGAIGVVELNRRVDVAKIQQFFVEKGVWIRPFGKLIYLMPPYISSETCLEKLCGAIDDAISQNMF
ncbi:adenosylmethionine--8-amino-7-oxononanoate transaminase [Pseudoalteromonas lipolytica]|uniref:Adenosylmethionine-8-amino-7-oxononanoate aminotransferase n=1 Tax=Pseudoalteromonas lipolytica TaxID=570156 RepID=A0AAD0WCF4_9GAMM|nr:MULTISPECIES: adenosylmethionine--8-amino-7-oxononanoate transaminase [Pseudoalteromonas]AXV65319.1 adenosylmethionine--8-amino-7-oxononanoate transaminase [Pseudoalteromonas donghaensis]EWH07105.1 adenosylmethionine-8-amino-7-oxononanoate aminotransferase [Pseudoalteromonas lipolytica SCSIO 04301]MBE0350870.1 adenosylmethionine-8-amino-7-oxononanoate aminotransferase [Pseudoalteromonas lipolytica LMEB 39]SFT92470.1 adenosylmethionine-8-amino-7-oxononanoate aminotransferase [Pseudoalteromona